MARSGLTWSRSPGDMSRGARLLGERVVDAVEDVMAVHAADAQGHMVETAPWTDRTANARQGLYGDTFRTATTVGMVLGGTMDYQSDLELANGGTYAVILPELRRRMAMIAADIDAVLA